MRLLIEQVRKRGLPPHSGSGGKPPFLTVLSHIVDVVLAALMLFNSVPSALACGPSETEPIFVSMDSPDLPFDEFTNGKIGIVQPSFGRKTLVIAYRYLNGGSFTADEQKDLIDALNGKAPEEAGDAAVKAWINGRQEFLKEEQNVPEIYIHHPHDDYDFFPNCTKNAFEVALQTLKDRMVTYGAEDNSVRTWLAAQDTVFANCSGGAQIPSELGAESPVWLRKDRDYQIAAAHFYSLNFDEARARFSKIAADADSPWQELGPYLIARTLVREASLGDEAKQREVYPKAETHLQNLVASGGKYADASKKLLGLVKYHLHPEDRVIELSRILTLGNNDNLRQDLIDYVWLLDKFDARILKEEQERKKKQEPAKDEQPAYASELSPEEKERVAKRERGDLIQIPIHIRNSDGTPDYSKSLAIELDYDTSEAETLAAFEKGLGRKLTDDESKEIKETRLSQLSYRQWQASPIRKWDLSGLSEYEGCEYACSKFNFDLIPEFLHSDDLTDWLLTIRNSDTAAYKHAISKWRETGSTAWMLAALMKTQKSSRKAHALMEAAERVTRDEPGFATAAYHLIRLKADMGQVDEARSRLDEIISWQSQVLPVSAQNLFLEQRMHLARGLNEFLKSAQRKPVAFYDYGTYGTLSDMLKIEKSFWHSQVAEQTKEEYDRKLDETYKDLLPWDNRFAFDDGVIDIFNWHFPLQLLAAAARNQNVPDYLQRSLVLAVWTRAILLKNDEIALSIAPEVVKVQPEMTAVVQRYLKSRTAKERHEAALYVLLKFPDLSPFVQGGLPRFNTSEGIEYYFESSWWCPPSETDYDDDGNEVRRVVPKPGFLTAAQLETARNEHLALAALGDGKRYLGKLAIEWAKTSPSDPRVPEALFIAAQANNSYKYGCDGWASDETTKQKAERILRQRYPQSPWTAKLSVPEN